MRIQRSSFMNYFSHIEKIGFICLEIRMKPVKIGYTAKIWGSSAIRGALGDAMIHRFCPQQKFNCDICQTPCSTATLFSTANPDKSEQAVNPYIIDYNEIIAENEEIPREYWGKNEDTKTRYNKLVEELRKFEV